MAVALMNGLHGIPSVINSAQNTADLMSNSSVRTKSTGRNSLSALGKFIEKHGQSLLGVAKLDAKQKVAVAKNTSKGKRQ